MRDCYHTLHCEVNSLTGGHCKGPNLNLCMEGFPLSSSSCSLPLGFSDWLEDVDVYRTHPLTTVYTSMVTSDQDSSGNCSQDPVLLLSVGKELLFLQTGEQIQENNYFCSNKRTTTGTVTLLDSAPVYPIFHPSLYLVMK